MVSDRRLPRAARPVRRRRLVGLRRGRPRDRPRRSAAQASATTTAPRSDPTAPARSWWSRSPAATTPSTPSRPSATTATRRCGRASPSTRPSAHDVGDGLRPPPGPGPVQGALGRRPARGRARRRLRRDSTAATSTAWTCGRRATSTTCRPVGWVGGSTPPAATPWRGGRRSPAARSSLAAQPDVGARWCRPGPSTLPGRRAVAPAASPRSRRRRPVPFPACDGARRPLGRRPAVGRSIAVGPLATAGLAARAARRPVRARSPP